MQAAIIPFEGVNLISVKDGNTGEIYVTLKPIVEALGLKWKSQWKKLKKLEEEKGVSFKVIPLETKGGRQEVITINIYHLPVFLYSIQPSRVKPELREKLIKFQKETTRVINDYWNKGAVINPRVEPENLKDIISQAIQEYEKRRTDQLEAELEKIRLQKVEVARRFISTLKDIPDIDRRYIKQIAKYTASLITGDIKVEKRQISVQEFLRSKKIYDRNARISFGRFLSQFYLKATGRKPKKSFSIVNGKEVETNYYTKDDLPVMQKAFEEWSKSYLNDLFSE